MAKIAVTVHRKGRQKNTPLLFPICQIRDFLNCNFEHLPAEWVWLASENAEEMLLPEVWALLMTLPLDDHWRQNAIDVQRELGKDLAGLISSEPQTQEQIQRDLNQLVIKTKGFGLHPEFEFVPAEYTITAPRELDSKNVAVKFKNPNLSEAGWTNSVLRIGKTKWVLAPKFSDLKTLKEKLYALVFTSCADGSIARLRQCKGCDNIFVLDHQTQKFCTTKCADTHFQKQAKWRVAKYRQKKRENERQLQRLERKRSDVMAFQNFLTQAAGPTREHKDILPLITKIPDRWKTINKWLAQRKKGKPVEQIWNELSDKTKRLFESDVH